MANKNRRYPIPIQESFEEAEQKLIEFLRSQGHPDQLVWTFREDVTGFRRQLFVHRAPLKTNRALARQLFNFGLEQGRGLNLRVPGFAEHQAYSYASFWAPDIDASQSLASRLILSACVESHETGQGRIVIRVPYLFLFTLRRLYCRARGEPFFVKEIPLRRNWQHLT